jgi:hypothetical protein
LVPVASFCGQCNCGCPELLLDPQAPEQQRVVLTDDFDNQIRMSLEQLRVLVADVKNGVLDGVVEAGVASSG